MATVEVTCKCCGRAGSVGEPIPDFICGQCEDRRSFNDALGWWLDHPESKYVTAPGLEVGFALEWDHRGVRRVYPGETERCDPPKSSGLLIVSVDYKNGTFDIGERSGNDEGKKSEESR